MKLGEMPFGTNIKIPERRENGTYELADYTLGCVNNFGAGTVGLVRKNIHSRCRFGDSTAYVGSDLDKRMAEINDSYPAELKGLIIPSTFPLYNKSGAAEITREVFALTKTMVGRGDNCGVIEGFAWPIFTGWNSRKKTSDDEAVCWWLSSQDSSDGAWYVNSNGASGDNYPSRPYGAVPAFTISQSTQIDDAPDEDGSYRLAGLTSCRS